MAIDAAKFGQGLTELMRRENVSTAMLAEWTSRTSATVCGWKAGRVTPTSSAVKDIEAVFRMTAAEIESIVPAVSAARKSVDTNAGRCFIEGLRILLEENFMTHRELADMVQTNVRNVDNWLGWKSSPRIDQALSVAEVFDMTVEGIVEKGRGTR